MQEDAQHYISVFNDCSYRTSIKRSAWTDTWKGSAAEKPGWCSHHQMCGSCSVAHGVRFLLGGGCFGGNGPNLACHGGSRASRFFASSCTWCRRRVGCTKVLEADVPASQSASMLIAAVSGNMSSGGSGGNRNASMASGGALRSAGGNERRREHLPWAFCNHEPGGAFCTRTTRAGI
jgi:hypothetical protein